MASSHRAARDTWLLRREQVSAEGEREESSLSPGILTRNFFKIANYLPGLALGPAP